MLTNEINSYLFPHIRDGNGVKLCLCLTETIVNPLASVTLLATSLTIPFHQYEARGTRDDGELEERERDGAVETGSTVS